MCIAVPLHICIHIDIYISVHTEFHPHGTVCLDVSTLSAGQRSGVRGQLTIGLQSIPLLISLHNKRETSKLTNDFGDLTLKNSNEK